MKNVSQLFINGFCYYYFIYRSVFCGPVNVLLENNGKSLKVGEVLLGDLQVLYELTWMFFVKVGLNR